MRCSQRLGLAIGVATLLVGVDTVQVQGQGCPPQTPPFTCRGMVDDSITFTLPPGNFLVTAFTSNFDPNNPVLPDPADPLLELHELLVLLAMDDDGAGQDLLPPINDPTAPPPSTDLFFRDVNNVRFTAGNVYDSLIEDLLLDEGVYRLDVLGSAFDGEYRVHVVSTAASPE